VESSEAVVLKTRLQFSTIPIFGLQETGLKKHSENSITLGIARNGSLATIQAVSNLPPRNKSVREQHGRISSPY
jgi:hypothetical protein